MEIVIVVITGFLLDCLFGDPRWLPHPIRLIGFFISKGEWALRKLFPKTSGGEIAAGAVLAAFVPLLSFGLCWLLLQGAAMIHIWLKYALEVLLCYQIFAAKSLKDESMRVYRHIEAEDLEGARKYLSWIVGRDTQHLNFKQITKAVVETIAENTSDGVIAPMLFMLLGGAPLGMLYKGVNTLDSMVGYKNDKYLYFGRVSAISDDVFNYIPARLTALFMILAAFLTGFDGKNAWRIYKRDRHNHASPNSAHPESACAGALRIQLAGDAYYFGKLYKKKTIGDDDRQVEAADIRRTAKLMYGACVLCLLLFAGIRICLELL
ncbi:adenosylcobinamide-phosphate synthase CbiB [Ihubacter sp. rT4E-8]|uniref:adenosylcobinamide-phosphate synthase CbiB n=1 Tax=Ihubacter sp. rT4E-8 TaxID=3242369 RepID=UPI003CF9C420